MVKGGLILAPIWLQRGGRIGTGGTDRCLARRFLNSAMTSVAITLGQLRASRINEAATVARGILVSWIDLLSPSPCQLPYGPAQREARVNEGPRALEIPDDVPCGLSFCLVLGPPVAS